MIFVAVSSNHPLSTVLTSRQSLDACKVAILNSNCTCKAEGVGILLRQCQGVVRVWKRLLLVHCADEMSCSPSLFHFIVEHSFLDSCLSGV